MCSQATELNIDNLECIISYGLLTAIFIPPYEVHVSNPQCILNQMLFSSCAASQMFHELTKQIGSRKNHEALLYPM
jgi:hypothetical protein